MSPEEDWTRDTVDSEPQHYQLSYSGPQILLLNLVPCCHNRCCCHQKLKLLPLLHKSVNSTHHGLGQHLTHTHTHTHTPKAKQKKTPVTKTACLPSWLTFNGASHVVVDDERHVLDVNTTASNICGHHDVLGSSLQASQGILSLLLALASVQCGCIVLYTQTSSQLIYQTLNKHMEDKSKKVQQQKEVRQKLRRK